jgi:transcriptional regulator with XRE-family HTH domain
MEDKEFLKRLGEEIAKIRKKQKLTQLDLASMADMEKPTITRLERGRTNPTSITLLKISRALGVPVSKLFSFQNKPAKNK